jgi:hypothetical protein
LKRIDYRKIYFLPTQLLLVGEGLQLAGIGADRNTMDSGDFAVRPSALEMAQSFSGCLIPRPTGSDLVD